MQPAESGSYAISAIANCGHPGRLIASLSSIFEILSLVATTADGTAVSGHVRVHTECHAVVKARSLQQRQKITCLRRDVVLNLERNGNFA